MERKSNITWELDNTGPVHRGDISTHPLKPSVTHTGSRIALKIQTDNI